MDHACDLRAMPAIEQDISRGGVLSPGQGRPLWFQGNLMTIKVAGEHTADAVAVVEGTFRAGHGPPLHVHRNEDELFYVVDGQMLVACDGRTFTAQAGDTVFLPRGLPHTFKVPAHGGPARALLLVTPARFLGFIEAAGEPAPEAVMPPDQEYDIARTEALAADYQFDVVGPPL
jgi:quercetin dioxygenase-like cupin family protein